MIWVYFKNYPCHLNINFKYFNCIPFLNVLGFLQWYLLDGYINCLVLFSSDFVIRVIMALENECDIAFCVSFRYTALQFNIWIPHKVITTMSLITIHHPVVDSLHPFLPSVPHLTFSFLQGEDAHRWCFILAVLLFAQGWFPSICQCDIKKSGASHSPQLTKSAPGPLAPAASCIPSS